MKKGTLQELIDFALLNEEKFKITASILAKEEAKASEYYGELYGFYPELKRRSMKVSELVKQLSIAQLDLIAYIKTFLKR